MMETVIPQYWHLAWMAAALFLMVYLGSPRHGGRMAYRRVRRLLTQSLDKRRYTQFHDLVLPTGGGTEHVDHVLVSRFGVFVIVSEHRPGVIAGGESQEYWKQTRLARDRRWPNPLYRARLQMEDLQRMLGMPRKCFHLVVAVSGQDKPLKKVPEKVLPINRLLHFIRSKTDQVLTPEQADRAVKIIAEAVVQPRRRVSKTAVAQGLLGLAIFAGVYFVFGDELGAIGADFDRWVERKAAPERFDEQGQRKSERELFEDSLICAFSQDTNRCSCYDKGGEKADIAFERCRELAERGSVLEQ